MKTRKKILGICGSASENSGNLSVLKYLATELETEFEVELIDNLADLPHFRTELTDSNVPETIRDFRNKISKANGILICTPEYVFSIPSGLKNALEWCVSTTVFTDKAVGLITASASGKMGHEELLLIMKTLQARFTSECTLLIQGIKGKASKEGEISDDKTRFDLSAFSQSFRNLV